MKQGNTDVELWQSTEKIKPASLPLFMGFGLATGIFGGALFDSLLNFATGVDITVAATAGIVGMATGFVAQRRNRLGKVRSQMLGAAYGGYLQIATEHMSEHKPTYDTLKSSIYSKGPKQLFAFDDFYQIDFECKSNDITHHVSVGYNDQKISTSITINELDNLEFMFESAVLFTGKTPEELNQVIRERHLLEAKQDILVDNLEIIRNECYYSPESLLAFADDEASAIRVTEDWKVLKTDYESGDSDLYNGYDKEFWNRSPYRQNKPLR